MPEDTWVHLHDPSNDELTSALPTHLHPLARDGSGFPMPFWLPCRSALSVAAMEVNGYGSRCVRSVPMAGQVAGL